MVLLPAPDSVYSMLPGADATLLQTIPKQTSITESKIGSFDNVNTVWTPLRPVGTSLTKIAWSVTSSTGGTGGTMTNSIGGMSVNARCTVAISAAVSMRSIFVKYFIYLSGTPE